MIKPPPPAGGVPLIPSSRSYCFTAGLRRGMTAAWRLEAMVGIEPTYKGFADLSLTTWVHRQYLFSTRIALIEQLHRVFGIY